MAVDGSRNAAKSTMILKMSYGRTGDCEIAATGGMFVVLQPQDVNVNEFVDASDGDTIEYVSR